MERMQRERYQEALAALEQARQQVTRTEMLYQLTLNRLREADVEGFAAEADELEGRSVKIEDTLAQEQQALLARASAAEQLRQLATVEEIDELATIFDQVLSRLMAALDEATAMLQEAHAASTRAKELADTLPPEFARAHRTAVAATVQARTVERRLAEVQAALSSIELPAPPPRSP